MKKAKKIFMKKYNNIFVLVLVSLISITLPSAIYAACNPGTSCWVSNISANSTADAKTGDGGGSCKGYKYCFSNTDENLNIQSFDIFYDSNGNPLLYLLHNDYYGRDKKTLQSLGIPESMIAYSNDLGLNLPVGSIEDENKANEWKKYYQDIKKDFAIMDSNGNYSINPNSDYYKLGVALGLYTGNVDLDTKNLAKGETTAFSLEKGTILTVNGSNKLLTSSNADSLCADRINDKGSKTGEYCRAIRDSRGQFDDEGDYECTVNTKSCVMTVMVEENVDQATAAATCCLMKYGADQEYGTCCSYFHTPDECKKKNEPDEPDEPDDPENNKCPSLPTVTPNYVTSPTRNASYSTGGSCGGSYTSVTYDYTQTMCEGLVVIEKQTTVSVNLSDLNQKIYYAGNTFNWGGISSYKNVMTRVFDTSALQNKIAELEATIQNIENQISTLECEISNMSPASSEACAKLTGEEQANCMADVGKANTGIEQSKNEKQDKIDKLKEDPVYKKAQEDIKTYNECLTSANNYDPTYTDSTDLVSVDKEQISFKNTNKVYQKREVVAISKNNGDPLTLKDMKNEILEQGTYLEIDSDYYVPISIKNGTTGIAQRKLTGENVSISYECQFNVANYIRCDGDECNSKGINIIYRPISLTNPFPITETQYKYRALGANWSVELAEKFILNNRNVSDYNVYNLKPLYTITLTPSTIKNIRNYNKKHSMNDFNLTCTNGYDCISKFLWEDFDGIVDASKSCASSSGLDQTCYNGGVS